MIVTTNKAPAPRSYWKVTDAEMARVFFHPDPDFWTKTRRGLRNTDVARGRYWTDQGMLAAEAMVDVMFALGPGGMDGAASKVVFNEYLPVALAAWLIARDTGKIVSPVIRVKTHDGDDLVEIQVRAHRRVLAHFEGDDEARERVFREMIEVVERQKADGTYARIAAAAKTAAS